MVIAVQWAQLGTILDPASVHRKNSRADIEEAPVEGADIGNSGSVPALGAGPACANGQARTLGRTELADYRLNPFRWGFGVPSYPSWWTYCSMDPSYSESCVCFR